MAAYSSRRPNCSEEVGNRLFWNISSYLRINMALLFRLNLKNYRACTCEYFFHVVRASLSKNVLLDVFRHKYFFLVSYYVTIKPLLCKIVSFELTIPFCTSVLYQLFLKIRAPQRHGNYRKCSFELLTNRHGLIFPKFWIFSITALRTTQLTSQVLQNILLFFTTDINDGNKIKITTTTTTITTNILISHNLRSDLEVVIYSYLKSAKCKKTSKILTVLKITWRWGMLGILHRRLLSDGYSI